MNSFCVERDDLQQEFPYGFRSLVQDGSVKMGFSSPSLLMLDGETGELVKANKMVRKELVERKEKMALRNHSEAERRRRERINSHLATLRGLVRCTTKMDKASLLAEVINKVKELERNSQVLTESYLVPTDFDELHVEYDSGSTDNGNCYIKTSICCGDHQELWAEIGKMVKTLQMKIVSAETATLGSRVKMVFVMMPTRYINEKTIRNSVKSVQQMLNSILERAVSSDFSPRSTTPPS